MRSVIHILLVAVVTVAVVCRGVCLLGRLSRTAAVGTRHTNGMSKLVIVRGVPALVLLNGGEI